MNLVTLLKKVSLKFHSSFTQVSLKDGAKLGKPSNGVTCRRY